MNPLDEPETSVVSMSLLHLILCSTAGLDYPGLNEHLIRRANQLMPSGTTNGWGIREGGWVEGENTQPCSQLEGYRHYMMEC
jgi:hypothetical protein